MAAAEAEIILSNGYVTVVDASYLRLLKLYRWHGKKCNGGVYAARSTTKKANGQRKTYTILMHRFIMNAPKGLQVDHINGDTLDNRRHNLELVTPEENLRREGLRRRAYG